MERRVSARVALRCRVGLLAILLLATLFNARPAWGRAGGGGGYSSSSSSSYSSSSSSSSSSSYSSSSYSSSSYSSSSTTDGYSSDDGSYGSQSGGSGTSDLGVFCVCGMLLIMSFGAIHGVSRLEDWMDARRATGAQKRRLHTSQENHRRVVAQIEQLDAAFDEQVFVAGFNTAFGQIQQAWMGQDMSSVTHFVTDGICEKFSIQFAEQQRQGFREELTQIKILDVRLAWFDSSGPFEVLSVEVLASMVDQRVDLKSGQTQSGNTDPEAFVEFWSFVRRQGTPTPPGNSGLFAGRCPNCGGAVELNQFGHCQVCGSVLRNGTCDWVLAEITQACEWREGVAIAVADAASEYRRWFDRYFSAQEIEDRAAVIFSRKALADVVGSLDPVRKMASPDFCRGYEGIQEARFLGDVSVGSIDFLGVLAEPNRHYALLEIRWAGRLFKRAENGKVWLIKRGWQRRRTVMVLGRMSTTSSSVAKALQSSHCPSCGAAEEDLTSDACPFCNAVANTGKYDWVLEAFVASNSDEGTSWQERLAALPPRRAAEGREERCTAGDDILGKSPRVASGYPASAGAAAISDTECLMWLIGLFAEDGRLDAAERQAIGRVAVKNGIPSSQVEDWCAAAVDGEFSYPATPDLGVQQAWVDQLVGVSLADGALTPDERRVLQEMARQLGMSRNQLRLLIDKATLFR